MNKKVVVIGLGGTGLEVIRYLRRIMTEQNDSLSNYPSAGFFYIDTDTTRVVKPHVGDSSDGDRNYSSDWSILGKPYHLLEKEYMKLQLPVISEMINNYLTRKNIEGWFPYEQLTDIDIATKGHPGAAQIRCLGRLAFYQNYTNIKNKFLDLYNSLPSPAGGAEIQIYICSSLSGGTGAGMFLDMAYSVKNWISTDNINTFGFLVLPKLSAKRGPRYFSNAYAALKELNYFTLNQAKNRRTDQLHPIKFSMLNESKNYDTPPFDNCYLMGMSNNTGAEIRLEDVPEMIAHRIYLNIDRSFNNAAKGLVQNANVERLVFLEDPVTGYKHAQNFFSFGLASIIYPLDKVKDLITYRLCSYTIERWLSESKESLDYFSEREKYLKECCLTDPFIKGYGNILSDQVSTPVMFAKMQDIKKDIKAEVLVSQEKCYDLVRQNIRDLLNHFIVETVLDRAKSLSLEELYEARSSNIPDAVKAVRKNLLGLIQRDFADTRRGISFLKRIFAMPGDIDGLESGSTGLLHYLEDKATFYQPETVDIIEKDKEYLDKIKSACASVDTARQKTFWRETHVNNTLENVYSKMEEYLNFKVSIAVDSYAVKLLKPLREEVVKVAEQVNYICSELNNLKHRFNEEIGRLTRYLANVENKWRGNTYILFEEELVDDIYSEILKQKVPQKLDQALKGYDLIGLVNCTSDGSVSKTDLNNNIYLEAVKLVESAEISRYLGKNIVQMFMSIYKDPSVRRKILDETYRQADFYFAFNGNEKNKGGKDSVYQEDANKMRSIVALAGSEEETPELAELKKELENAGVNLTDDVKIITNPYQMIFLRETSAFPLRLGQDVKVLREKYDYLLDNNKVPLHISKNFSPPMQELFLSDDEDTIRRYREHFYVGRILGWVRPETDKIDHADKVYYEYRVKGSPRHIFMARTWMESMVIFSGIDDRDLKKEEEKLKDLILAREALGKQVEDLVRRLDTVEKKKKFVVCLQLELDLVEKEVELGKQDVFYVNCRDIIDQIKEKNFYGLNKIKWDDNIDWQAESDKFAETGKKPDIFAVAVNSARSLHTDDENDNVDKPIPNRSLIDYAIMCIKNDGGKVTPDVTRSLGIRAKSLKIKESLCDDLIAEAIMLAERELSPSVPMDDAEEGYRFSCKQFMKNGEMSLDVRKELDKLKNDLGLSDETALAIESSLRKELGLSLP